MSLAMLDEYKVIGWDFDGTLFDHAEAKAMQKYILAHPEKTHYIVTFRSGDWAQMVWLDLEHSGLTADHFAGLINMGNEEFMQNCSRHLGSGLFTTSTDYYKRWKGAQCRKYGIEVLIDDNHHDTAPGCYEHGIILIHPDDFA